MMRSKLMLWGAAAAVALGSTAAVASVVVVKSLGPVGQGLSAGQDAARNRKDHAPGR